jgi:hypothetical protein
MDQELPLTPAMTDYFQSIALRKGNVTSLVIFVLVLCSTAPAFLSFVSFFQHRPLAPGLVVVWLVFLGLGIGLIYLGLRYARLASRDLAGGVYVRWTGSFTTRVVYGSRYSKGFQVEVGGHKLESVAVQRLPPIGLNSGTVDYLPATKTVIEVRNEEGALLWSRFVTTGDSLGSGSPSPE